MSDKIGYSAPETPTIEKLAGWILEGSIVLPKFQRPFVWRKSEIIDLLESIESNYPIGSILLWESSNQELNSARQIGDLDVDPPRKGHTLRYVLDGQQRLASICGTLFWRGEKPNSNWNVAYDLREEIFMHLRHLEELPPHQIRLNQLLGDPFFDYFLTLDRFDGPDKEVLKERARNLNRQFAKYTLPIIVLKDVPARSIATIFEQINKTGRRLTTVDLMQAATWSSDFDLMNSIESIRSSYSDNGFSNIEPINILRNISAAAGGEFFAGSIMDLRDLEKENLHEAVLTTRKAYDKAVDFFTKTVGINGMDAIPYANQITVVAEILGRIKRLSHSQTQALLEWFWQTSVTDYFQGWNTARMAADLNKLKDFAQGKIEKITLEARYVNAPGHMIWIEEKYSSRNALSRAFLILLMQNQPMDLLAGLNVSPARTEDNENSMELHHVFPQKYLKNRGVNAAQIDCLANRIMLQSRSNKTISAKAPSVYLQEVIQLAGSNLDKVLASNLISQEAFEAACKDDFDTFMDIRARDIHKSALKRAGWATSEPGT